MNQTSTRPAQTLPRTLPIGNERPVTLRLMTPADANGVLAFARALPEDDLLFLRIDITQEPVVRQWVANLESGRTTTVLAEAGGAIVGYASLHHNDVSWQRHLGEIRIQTAPGLRARGLGRALAAEIFAIAKAMGLRIVVAQMVAEQKSAVATFKRLGFQMEALLQDFAIDRAGRTHDLIVMAYDVDGLTDSAD